VITKSSISNLTIQYSLNYKHTTYYISTEHVYEMKPLTDERPKSQNENWK